MHSLSSAFKSTALLLLCAGFLSVCQASVVTVVGTRGGIGETDFVDWGVIALIPGTQNSPINATTNLGVGFSHTQTNTNPLNCQTGGGCNRFFNFMSGGTSINGFDTFSPMTMVFSTGFGAVGFDATPEHSTTLRLQVTHGGVQDAMIVFLTQAGEQFLGVQSDANDITQVIVSVSGEGFNGILNGDTFYIDRVSLRTNGPAAPEVPEPGTFAMLALGGAAALACARKRRAPTKH